MFNQNYADLTTNVKMTAPTTQVPNLLCESIYGVNGSSLPALLEAWVALPANKYKAIVKLSETFTTAYSSGTESIYNPPKNSIVTVITFTGADMTALIEAFNIWRAANPTYRVIRRGEMVSVSGVALYEMIVEYCKSDATGMPSDAFVISTSYSLYVLNIFYYDYSPVTVPIPPTGAMVPPPCACGS